jgi:hypothetical protein
MLVNYRCCANEDERRMPAAAPPGDLTPTARAVLEALQSVSSLAWPILKAQCDLASLDPSLLTNGEVPLLVPRLIEAVARFGSKEKADRLRKLLARLEPVEPPARSPIPKAGKPPELGQFSQRVLAELERLSPLAWSLLEAQCSRVGLDATNLTPPKLIQVLPAVEKSLARFTSPDKAARARAALDMLAADCR